jgi:hypothetical protein
MPSAFPRVNERSNVLNDTRRYFNGFGPKIFGVDAVLLQSIEFGINPQK